MLMIRIFGWKLLQHRPSYGAVRRNVTVLVLAAIVFPIASSAATIDWNTASGNWNVAANWYDYAAAAAPATPPGSADDVEIRNGGAVTLNDSQSALNVFLGFARNVELDPINNPGVLTDLGLDGQLDWSAGTLGTANLRIGKEHNGVVNQNGGDITLPLAGATFRLGDTGQVGTGTYTMTAGSITMQGGSNGNNGIEVVNGTFNMKGGTVSQMVGTVQRVFRIGTKNLSTATVNISGGTVNAPMGGIRLGDSGTATGVLNVNQNDGTTNITLGGDLAIGRSTASLGKMTMSAGTITIGTTTTTARLQVGNSGRGEFDMTGGSIDVFNGLRIGQAPATQGSYFKFFGGTLTTRAFDSRTDNASASIPETGSTFTIDGGTYNQIAGSMDIGQKGKITVELKSGIANVPALIMGATADSKAVLSISGGAFTLGGNLSRTTVSGNDVFGNPMTAPVVNLTGGQLVMNPAASPLTWQVDFNNQGTEIVQKLNAVIQTTVGDSTHPGNFAMSSGIWDIDINGHTVTSADRFVVSSTGGTGSLTGGTLNLNFLSGYTPTVGDSFRIVQATGGGVTLNAGAVAINAPVSPGGSWELQTVGTDIRLAFIPEPGTCGLFLMGALTCFGGRRRSLA